MLRTTGILIASLIFFAAGGMLGDAGYDLLFGDPARFTSEPIPMWFTVVSNPICWLCIWLLWRRAARSAAIRPDDSRLRLGSLVFQGLPVTGRVALLVFSTLWTLGLLFGLLVPFIDPGLPR